MNQDRLIAYNSKAQSLIFLIMAIVLIPICCLAAINSEEYRVLIILPFGLVICILLFLFFYSFTFPRIVLEIKNEKIFIYQHNKEIIIPLSDITKVALCDNTVSFDARIYYTHGKKGLHRMIKNKKSVYKDFIELMRKRSIHIEYYSA